MHSAEALRDAYHDLESALDARAAEFVDRATVATRDDLGEVCLTAQLWAERRDARFEFREEHATERRYAALRLETRAGKIAVAFQPDDAAGFPESLGWAYFDTLSKLLIIEALELAAARG